MDLTRPFRGSLAVASGAQTRGVLTGPRFSRLYPDIHGPAELDVDLTLLSCAAALLVGDDGVLSGYSAAELLDASCGPPDAPAEVTVRRYRPVSRLLVHRDALDTNEVIMLRGGWPVVPPGHGVSGRDAGGRVRRRAPS